MRRKRACLALVAAAAAAAIGADGSRAQSGCEATQILNVNNFESRVCDMPDYDQRRKAGTIAGDGRTFGLVGLRADGKCHCVPTVLTDLLGYYAQKGIDIPPRRYGPWYSRGFDGFTEFASNQSPATYLSIQPYKTGEVFAYNNASNLVRRLGGSVVIDDDTCGTNFGAVIDAYGARAAEGDFAAAFLNFGFTDTGPGTGRAIAALMHGGGVAGVAYGRYEDYEQEGSNVNVGDRIGGHALAVVGIEGHNSFMKLRYLNPDTHETDDRFRNSLFKRATVELHRFKDKGLVVDDWYYRFGPEESGSTQRLVDNYMAIYPQILIAGSGDDLEVVSGFDLNRQDGRRPSIDTGPDRAAAIAVQADGNPEPVTRRLAVDGLIDAVPMPMTGEVAYLERGSRSVKAFVPGTRLRRTLGPAPAGAMDLEASPTGRLVFALGDRSVVALDRDGGIVNRRHLDAPAAAIAYDWSPRLPFRQRLGVIFKGDRRLALLRPRSLEPTRRVTLPRRLLRGQGRLRAGFGPGGRLQVRVGKAGFATLDNGTVLTTKRGKVRSLGGASPFDGLDLKGARVLSVSHTGADFTRAQTHKLIDKTSVRESVEPVPGATPTPTPTPTPSPSVTPTPSATATPSPQPNLVVDKASGVQAVIRNAGTVAAGPFTASLSQGNAAPLNYNFSGLAAGASATLNYACRKGTRTLTVDSGNQVAESNETDNVRQFSSTCARRGPLR